MKKKTIEVPVRFQLSYNAEHEAKVIKHLRSICVIENPSWLHGASTDLGEYQILRLIGSVDDVREV